MGEGRKEQGGHSHCVNRLRRHLLRVIGLSHADWNPKAQQVIYESLINIRPRQKNPSLEILDPAIRKRVAEITYQLLGGI